MDSRSAPAAGRPVVSTRATRRALSANFSAVLANKPHRSARRRITIWRARIILNKQDEKAKDELLAALETAPGFRQAQKLLLELSGNRLNDLKK